LFKSRFLQQFAVLLYKNREFTWRMSCLAALPSEQQRVYEKRDARTEKKDGGSGSARGGGEAALCFAQHNAMRLRA
jgi:hypothetical protein